MAESFLAHYTTKSWGIITYSSSFTIDDQFRIVNVSLYSGMFPDKDKTRGPYELTSEEQSKFDCILNKYGRVDIEGSGGGCIVRGPVKPYIRIRGRGARTTDDGTELLDFMTAVMDHLKKDFALYMRYYIDQGTIVSRPTAFAINTEHKIVHVHLGGGALKNVFELTDAERTCLDALLNKYAHVFKKGRQAMCTRPIAIPEYEVYGFGQAVDDDRGEILAFCQSVMHRLREHGGITFD